MKTTKPATIILCTLLAVFLSACGTGKVGDKSDSQLLTSNQPTLVFLKPTKLPTRTPAKTATTLPTHASTPTEIPSIEFDLSEANKVLPEDIFKEVSYYGLGGDPFECNESANTPVMCKTPNEVEYLMPVTLFSSGWSKSETIKVTVKYPDGRLDIRAVQADTTHLATFVFKPMFDNPLGLYTFTFGGKNGIVETTLRYIKPDGPRLLPIDDTHMLLYGFAPYESVKLFCYDGDNDRFKGWKAITVDKMGNQVVSADLNACNFAALNESWAEVHLLGVKNAADELHWGHTIIRTDCGGLKTRLFVHGTASVAFTDGSNMRLRAKPGFSQPVLAKVPEGTHLDIMDGPKCVNDSIWWKVLVLSGSGPSSGWMTEEQSGVYLLQPEKY